MFYAAYNGRQPVEFASMKGSLKQMQCVGGKEVMADLMPTSRLRKLK